MAYSNIALKSELGRTLFKEQIKNNREKCVFISHKKEDKNAALSIGSYLTDIVGVNIYLDVMDENLQKATQIENDKMIVESIKNGLECSSHLLCLISDKTRLSWWVPYEVGIADNKNLNIATLKLNTTDDIPSFLKIHPSFFTVEEFINYAVNCKTSSHFLYESMFSKLSANTDVLKKYIDY